jgi:DNA-binding NtrC family response regulator
MLTSPSTPASNRSAPSVLVVDDEPVIRDFVCEILEAEGMTTVPMETADSAAEYLNEHVDKIDILITDIRMPGSMDGAALANLVASKWPQIPIIVMSGYETPATASIRYKVRFLPKPWSIGQLLDSVSGVAYSVVPSN